MSKFALAAMLTERLGLPKADAMEAVDTMLDGVQRVLLSRGRVTFVGFGSFSLRERRSRRKAGEQKIEIRTEVVFTPGEGLAGQVESRHPRRTEPASAARRRTSKARSPIRPKR